jgi:drug/metabolite transporter (DMT)-like permease
MEPAPDSSQYRPATWAIVLAFVLVYICWGTTYLAVKKGVREEHWPPGLFGGVRLALAGLILLCYQRLRGQSLRLPAGDYLPVVICAVLLFVFGNGLITVAGQTLDSSVSAVLAATTPLWVGLFELFWPQGERLSGRGWLGLLLGLGSVVVLCLPNLQGASRFVLDPGILCVLGSASSWALGSLVTRHHRVSCSHLMAASYQLFLGGTGLAAVGVACGELGRLPDQVTATAVAAFLWLLVAGSLVGYVAFNWLLAHVSVAQVGTYAYVNPAIAVILGIIDGEEPTVWLLGGITGILLSVALVRGGVNLAKS